VLCSPWANEGYIRTVTPALEHVLAKDVNAALTSPPEHEL
jgi:hypothetical protein